MQGSVEFGGFGVMNVDPLVINVWWYDEDVFRIIGEMSQIAPDVPACFLVTNAWAIVDRWRSGNLATCLASARRHRRAFPKHKVIVLGNDEVETALLSQLGIPAVTCNHNAFLDCARIPVAPRGRDGIVHPALYNARIEPYKRIELMAALPGSALVAAAINRDYLNSIRDLVRHVTWLNGSMETGAFERWPSERVFAAVQQSGVGLCLSEVEGAMFASGEYLLTGRPVVSTHSMGGRDSLFDPDFCITCEAHPETVAAAVREMNARQVDPAHIRHRTRAAMMRQRVDVVTFLSDKGRIPHGDLGQVANALLSESHAFVWRNSTCADLATELRQLNILPHGAESPPAG